MNMQTKIILAIVIIAAAATLVLAPSLSSTPVQADKHKTCTTGGSDNPCPNDKVSDPGQAGKPSCKAGNGDVASPKSCNGAK
jgi:uncharacterized membrane protein